MNLQDAKIFFDRDVSSSEVTLKPAVASNVSSFVGAAPTSQEIAARRQKFMAKQLRAQEARAGVTPSVVQIEGAAPSDLQAKSRPAYLPADDSAISREDKLGVERRLESGSDKGSNPGTPPPAKYLPVYVHAADIMESSMNLNMNNSREVIVEEEKEKEKEKGKVVADKDKSSYGEASSWRQNPAFEPLMHSSSNNSVREEVPAKPDKRSKFYTEERVRVFLFRV